MYIRFLVKLIEEETRQGEKSRSVMGGRREAVELVEIEPSSSPVGSIASNDCNRQFLLLEFPALHTR